MLSEVGQLDISRECVAREVVSIQPQVQGRITEIHFTDGADVKKGDPLFTIDPEPFRAVVVSAEANLARAKAVLELARSDYARIAWARQVHGHAVARVGRNGGRHPEGFDVLVTDERGVGLCIFTADCVALTLCDEEAGVLWEELHNTFAAELPADLYREIFESRRIDMIAANEWPKDKPLPDPEQYLGRAMLEATLKDMKYVPTKIEAQKK